MLPDLLNPVPDIGELVVHENSQWRVTGWYRLDRVPAPKTTGRASEIMRAIAREDPNSIGYRLVPCTRAEATTVSLYAVTGALVRTGAVLRLGRYVDWSDETINEDCENWLMAVRDPDSAATGLGRSHPATLRRLYPDVDLRYPW